MTDPWIALRRVTPARIALGHAGAGLPTAAHLDFQLAHARARDAVIHPLDVDLLTADLSSIHRDVRHVRTEARDRIDYLAHPQKGARLDAAARGFLMDAPGPCDVAFVIADGLAAAAVARHAPPLLSLVVPRMKSGGWNVGPLIVVTQGRVAIGDNVGALLGARIAAVLIGERPGLSAPDSMGIYITYGPQPGRTNAERNCISNIRPEGLGYEAAASKLLWLLQEARRRELTGVALKEEESPALP